MTIETLNSMAIPESLGIQRDSVVPTGFRNPEFDQEYDFRTFFYDAFFVPRNESICLICPKLLNLEAVVADAIFTANDQNLRPRLRRRSSRNDEIWLRCPGLADRLRVRIGSLDCEIPIGVQDQETFKGLRCAVLKSKDNELVWIRDWADYHVKVHGLEGLVFFDNASDKYSTQELHSTLLGIDGLKKVRVLSAPFAFGPLAQSRYRHRAKFLQGGLINIARLRYLQSAAAVLLADIDELVAPTPGGSVFSLAERSAFGYVAFRGRWRHAKTTGERQIRHLDHVYEYADDPLCPSKYCISSQGPFRKLHWDTHIINAGFFGKAMIDTILTTSRVEYWHCWEITTHWKRPKETPTSQLRLDSRSKRVLDRIFGN